MSAEAGDLAREVVALVSKRCDEVGRDGAGALAVMAMATSMVIVALCERSKVHSAVDTMSNSLHQGVDLYRTMDGRVP